MIGLIQITLIYLANNYYILNKTRINLLCFAAMGTKKSKTMNGSQGKKKNLKFKDLDELINEPTIPVGVGTQVHCSGSDIRGIVILNKQRKAMIDYTIDNKKKLATIPQFYKSVTGMPLHAKGNTTEPSKSSESRSDVTDFLCF